MIYSVPASHYISPDMGEITAGAVKFDLNTPDHDFLTDVANIASGGRIKTEEELRSQSLDVTNVQVHVERTRQFLEGVDFDQIPGNTPLEKALALSKYMESCKGQPEASEFNEMTDDFNKMSPEERELSGGSFAQFILESSDIEAISRELDLISDLRVSRMSKPIPDPHGNLVRSRPVKDLNELSRVPQAEWALPELYRIYRVLSHQTLVRERVSMIERRQLIYMIVDASGSMQGDRFTYALGVLLNRIKAVIRGDAEMWFAWFSAELEGERHIPDKDTAVEVYKEVVAKGLPGGGTYIDGCIAEAIERIHELQATNALWKPELVVVSDGCDEVYTIPSNLRGIRLHSFNCLGSNPELERLARQSGGVSVKLNQRTIKRRLRRHD